MHGDDGETETDAAGDATDGANATGVAGLDLSPAELGERLREASETGRSLFTLLGRAGALELLYEVGANGPVRFSELQRSLDLSSATLSARLSELAAAGFVDRTAYDEIPARRVHPDGPADRPQAGAVPPAGVGRPPRVRAGRRPHER